MTKYFWLKLKWKLSIHKVGRTRNLKIPDIDSNFQAILKNPSFYLSIIALFLSCPFPTILFVALKIALNYSGFHDPCNQLYHQTQVHLLESHSSILPEDDSLALLEKSVHLWMTCMAWEMNCPLALALRPKSLFECMCSVVSDFL